MSSAAANTIMSGQPHHAPAKKLAALLAGISEGVPVSAQVADLTLDSRRVSSGAAFVALPGLRSHGVAFAADAVAAGATAVLWEPTTNVVAPTLPTGVVVIAIPELTRKLGAIADRFFDAPSKSIRVAGVTGTNGKTTTAYMLAAALERLGEASAYAGTLGVGRVAAPRSRVHTTPDCISVHRELAELRDTGVRSLGMEVSSHALDQHRVAGVRFDAAVFTNLTHDHLDYHGTFEAYGAAKMRLFEWPDLQHAVINFDDAFGRQIASRAQTAAVTLYGRDPALPAYAASQSRRCHIRAVSVAADAFGMHIEIDSSWGHAYLRSRLIGDFNVDNLLAVLATLLGFDIPLADCVNALEACTAPPGRMEMLTAPDRPTVIVDYAHTPDALDKTLRAIRNHCAGRIVCVFGCGGERDAAKRPLMGAIAERLADAVIVTDDNPRNEDGDRIVETIVRGMQQPQRACVQRDRAAAIASAIAQARAGDVVLIAGKGHEDYQIVGGVKRSFSDRDVALSALGRGS